MPPIYLYNGKILVRNNQIAAHENCCCVSPTLTPTLTLTPTPPKPGCACGPTVGVCSSVTWSVNSIYDALGNQFDITDTIAFEGLTNNYVSPTNPAVNVSIGYVCDIVDKQLVIDLSISLLFNAFYYCKPNGDVGEGIYNSQSFTRQIVGVDCDEFGFIDISGNYNMDIFGVNCPQGDTTFQATWTISQLPCA